MEVIAKKSCKYGEYGSFELLLYLIKPNSFISAMFIGTIDVCHFIPVSMTLTLGWGFKVSRMENLLVSFFSLTF